MLYLHPAGGTNRVINSIVPLLVPLMLTTGTDPQIAPTYHQVHAYVTGYNTVPAQTDSTPCIAASGANICGRHDAVACPSRISLGTVVEIRGTTYVCEDRLARKFDSRFDISCDKDVDCPSEVTGWATINVYGEFAPAPPHRPPHQAVALRTHAAAVGRPALTVAVLRGSARMPGLRHAVSGRPHAPRIVHG